jgi:site-specific DNA-methyltransferase (adenine-specific)
MLAKKQPLKIHEDIIIFCNGLAPYHPQGLIECDKITKQGSKVTDNNGGGKRDTSYRQTHTNYPRTIQEFKSASKTVHSTQKPVALMEYLIKTYTNEGETVLDFTMGSGTTGVAAKNLNRDFIGIELDEGYFNISKERIESA